MMTTELLVETELIRQAAEVLQEASMALEPGGALGDCPLSDASLGRSAVAREVAGAAARRVLQACDAARLLAGLVGDGAAALRRTADAFDLADSLLIAPPR